MCKLSKGIPNFLSEGRAVCATLPDEGKYLTGNTAMIQEGITGNG